MSFIVLTSKKSGKKFAVHVCQIQYYDDANEGAGSKVVFSAGDNAREVVETKCEIAKKIGRCTGYKCIAKELGEGTGAGAPA